TRPRRSSLRPADPAPVRGAQCRRAVGTEVHTVDMQLLDVADTSAAVADVSGRLAKTELIAACLRRATPAEAEVVASYLSGELRQRRTGLGYAALRSMPPAAAEATLDVLEV